MDRETFPAYDDLIFSLYEADSFQELKKRLFAEFDCGNQDSLRDPETIVRADAARVSRAVEAIEKIELPLAEVHTPQPVKTEKGQPLVLKFAAPVKPELDSLRLGVCRIRSHEKQYAKAVRLEDLGGGVYEAVFNPDPMLDYTAKGVHESFLGGADRDGNPFTAKIMIDSDAEPLPST